MDLDLKNKNALVTGGSHGIGRSIALALAKEGCNVAICGLDKKEIDDTTREIEEKNVKSIGVVADVKILADVDNVIKTISDLWGVIDILVNNVGGGGGRVSTSVEETPEELWADVYNRNALAAIRFTTKIIPFMKKQKWGRVVTIASLNGKEGGGRPWYNMAKSAEISLMKTLAMDKETVRLGITFNSIAPGAIIFEGNEWDVFQNENPKKFKNMEDLKPLGRLGQPEEIAGIVAFLCSKKASFINGACISADGGESKSF